MAQIIKNRRGSLERISAVSSSFQKGELIITSGSSNLTTTNGSSILFAATESGSVEAVNRFLMGTNAPNVFSSSIYNGLVKGVPYYASGSSTLYLLGSDKNDIPDLTGNISNFSSSVSASISALSASIGGGSIGNSVTLLSSKTGSYATTGSNTFKGEQIISSSLIVTNEIKGTGSIFLQPDVNDVRKIEIYNTAATDVHIKATTGLTFLGDDTNYVSINDSAQTITITGSNGVYVGGIAETIGAFSQSVDSRLSNLQSTSASVNTSIAALNTSSASQQVSIDALNSYTSSNTSTTALNAFTASADGRLNNLQSTSASVNTSVAALNVSSASLNSFTSSILQALTASGTNLTANGNLTVQGNLTVAGTTTAVNSTTVQLGDNIIELNGTGVANGGLLVKDPTAPNTVSGSLLWDSTNDYWKAGALSSESKLLRADGDSVVSGSSQITITSTTGFDTYSGSVSASFAEVIANVGSGVGVSITNLNSFSSSTLGRLTNIESTSASVNTSVAALNVTSTSLNTFTASADGRLTNLESKSSSVDTSIAALNSYTSSNTSTTALNAFTASASGRLNNLESTSASVNTSITALNSSTASQQISIDALNVTSASVNTFSGSTLGRLTNLESTSASVNTSVTALNSSTASQQISIDALNSYTSSNTSTTALNAFTASANVRLSNLEETSASVNGRLSNIEITSASVNTSVSELNAFSSSTLGRLSNIEITSASVNTLITNLNTVSSSNLGRLSNIEITSASVNTLITNLNTVSSSNLGRLSNLELTSASVNISIGALNTTTGSLNNSVSALNTVSASNLGRLTNLETTSASVNTSVSNLNTTTASLNTSVSELNSYSSSLRTAFTASGVNVTFNGDTTVKGNLYVQGTQTVVDSTTINLADNVIVLNAAGTSDGGLIVRDATGASTTSGSLLWDVTNDYWKAGVLGAESKLLRQNGDSVVSGSSQINITGSTGFDTYSGSVATSISASSAAAAASATWASLSGKPGGIVSGSSQVVLNDADKTGFSTDDVTEGSNLYYTDARVKTKLNTETVVSGSVQVDITATTGFSTFSSSIETRIQTIDGGTY